MPTKSYIFFFGTPSTNTTNKRGTPITRFYFWLFLSQTHYKLFLFCSSNYAIYEALLTKSFLRSNPINLFEELVRYVIFHVLNFLLFFKSLLNQMSFVWRTHFNLLTCTYICIRVLRTRGSKYKKRRFPFLCPL